MQRGYSLIELVMVMGVLAILGAVILPLWPGKSIELHAQADRLATDIRYTQHLAETRGVRYQLYQINSTSYRIQSIETTPQVIDTVTLTSGISFAAFPNGLIAFSTNGTPYLNALIPGTALSVNAAIQLTTGNKTTSITITPETGKVSVS